MSWVPDLQPGKPQRSPCLHPRAGLKTQCARLGFRAAREPLAAAKSRPHACGMRPGGGLVAGSVGENALVSKNAIQRGARDMQLPCRPQLVAMVQAKNVLHVPVNHTV